MGSNTLGFASCESSQQTQAADARIPMLVLRSEDVLRSGFIQQLCSAILRGPSVQCRSGALQARWQDV